jgi:AraC family transcriptional regulator
METDAAASAFSDDQVRIVDFPATPVAILEHRGDPALIGDTIRRFIAWRKQAGLPPKVSATFNILHCDPETTPPEEYRLSLCAALPPKISGSAVSDEGGIGVVAGLIPAGRCAALRLLGSSDDLKPAVSFLYADWLPRSGAARRDFPIFVQRLSFFPEVPENEAVTDIFLPLQ